LSQNETYHKTLPSETAAEFSKFPFGEKERKTIEEYLVSRETGKNDWISFARKTEEKISEKFYFETGFNRDSGFTLLLTNVMWDAQVNFASGIYESMLEWLFETVEYFIANKTQQLAIRIHPAEVVGTIKSRQPVAEELFQRFGKLPTNIFLIEAENKIFDVYSLADLCRSVLVYGTKAGLEIAARGKLVITTGDAWHRNKGISVEPEDKDGYLQLLSEIDSIDADIKALSDNALRYAHYLFFRRMIPLKSLENLSAFGPFVLKSNLNSAIEVLQDENLNFVVDRIIDGKPFVLAKA
jgi:hypothetical protein